MIRQTSIVYSLVLMMLTGAADAQDLIINEVMASNANTLADEDGDNEDWIELYNFGTESISLEGFGLSDDYDDPFRWYFPDMEIGAGEYLLVWASGKNRRDPDEPMHTIFSISSAGEEVLLTAPDGTRLDELAPTHIPTDISIGRLPDDLENWFFFDQPTPGDSNTTDHWQGIADPPLFSHSRGFYNSPFHLELDGGDGQVSIYYTLDGSEPDPGNLGGRTFQYKNEYPTNPGMDPGPFLEKGFQTHPYVDPIPITDQTGGEGIHQINTSYNPEPLTPLDEVFQGMVVRARAYREGYLPSKVKSHTFLVGEDIHDRFDLPVVSVTLPDSSLFDYYRGIYVAGDEFDYWRSQNPLEAVWPGVPGNWAMRGFEWERRAHVELFDNQGNAELTQNLGTRIHGGWSRSNAKKSFRFYARNIYDTDNEIHYTFFPGDGRALDDQDTEVFKRIMLRAGGNVNNIVRDVAALDLLWNTNVGVQRGRPVVHFVNGVYWGIVNFRDRQDRYHIAWEYDIDPDNVIMLDSPWRTADESWLEEGIPEDLDLFNDVYRFITRNDMSDAGNYAQVLEDIDIDSYLDYYISFLYLGNTDWDFGRKHWRFWRVRETSQKPYQDGKWRVLVWDFDSGLTHADLLTELMDHDGESSDMFHALMANEDFRHRLINRMADLMNSHFKPDHALEVLNSRYAAVENELDHDQSRWDRDPVPWFQVYLDFAKDRPAIQRQEMMDVLGLPDTSKVTLKTNPAQGRIRINTVEIQESLPGVEDPGNWTGTYFHDVPIEVEAIPGPGMVFSHWEELPAGTPARTSISLEHDTTLTAVFWDGVVHYWHFNFLPDEDFVQTVNADYSLFPDDALLRLTGEGDGYLQRTLPGTNLNIHLDFSPGFALAVNQPAVKQQLVFEVPTEGQHSLQFAYAMQYADAGLASHRVCYSPDRGQNWHLIREDLPIEAAYALYAHDLSELDDAIDNEDLWLRISFLGEDGQVLTGQVLLDNVVVKEAPLELVAEMAPGQEGQEYAFQLEAQHGLEPFQFRKVSGRLPQGLSLSANGEISGIPTEEGSFAFEVEVSDQRNAHATKEYVLTIYHRSLIHYWHFNALADEVPDTVFSDFSATDDQAYLYYPGTGDGYMDRVADGSELNSWSGTMAESGLRVRNPAETRELRFVTPSTDFDYLRFSFAVHRTNNGAQWQLLEYSPDGGDSWHTADGPYRITTDYNVRYVDLRDKPNVTDNDDLMFRIFFLGPEAANTSGNNRFDNIALKGVVAPDYLDDNELFVFPNPVTDGVIHFLTDHDINIYDTYGRHVFSADDVSQVRLPELASGVYIIVTEDGQYARIIVP